MMTWLSQLFIHPAMAAGGAALIAIPIIIHLINRLRYRKVRFAAMEFLLQSQQQNRRRILIEQLLLLLLRILLVLGIIALFARLILDPSQLSLLERPQTHHLVVLDDSGSMRDRWGETSAWQEGLKAVKRIASEMANQDGIHTLTLMQTSQPDRTTSNFTRREIDISLLGELEDKLETMQRDCSYAQVQWTDTFSAIERILSAGNEENTIIHVISDFRQPEWGDSPTLVSDIEALAGDHRAVNLIPAVPNRHQNLAVTSFDGELHTAAVMVPVELTAQITNFGESLAENIAVRVLVDGEPIPQAITIPKINPGDTVAESFEVTITTPGEHSIAVQIPADALEADNSRYIALNLPQVQRVLIADGSDSTSESQYIADALSADPGITGIEASIVRAEDLRDQDLAKFSAVYLLNVPRLSTEALKLLSDYVEQGGGIAWFMGDKVDGSFYRQLAQKNRLETHGQELRESDQRNSDESNSDKTERKKTDQRPGFQSLFPVLISQSPVELERADETNPGPDLILNDHPLFEILNAENGLLANFINIYRYFPVDTSTGSGLIGQTHLIGKLRNQAPLFVESRLGEGRIFVSLTSAGPMNPEHSKRWNNWPFDVNAPGFTVFHLELVKYLGSRKHVRPSLQIAEPLAIQVNPSVYTPEVRFTPPEGLGLSSVVILATAEQKRPAEQSGQQENSKQPPLLQAVFHATQFPGVYRVEREDLARETTTTLYAFNVPAEEGRLEMTPSSELRSKLSSIPSVIVQDYGKLQGIKKEDPGRELRTLLLLLLVLILIAEQALAYRLSFHSRPSQPLIGGRSSGGNALQGSSGPGGEAKPSPSPVFQGGNFS